MQLLKRWSGTGNSSIYIGRMLLLASFVFSQPAFSLSGEEVIARVDAHEDGYTDLKAKITMTLIDADGSRHVRKLLISSFESKPIGDKRKFDFEEPADIKGTAILIHSLVTEDDRQWVYLPAFKRIKRVSSTNRKTPFMGSEFTYEDLASQEKEKYRNELVAEKSDKCGCWVVKRTPLLPHSGYSYLLAYVNRNDRYEIIEYFGDNDEKLKTLNISQYHLYKGRYLLASTYDMKNHKTNKETIMSWEDISLMNRLNEIQFLPESLRIAR